MKTHMQLVLKKWQEQTEYSIQRQQKAAADQLQCAVPSTV